MSVIRVTAKELSEELSYVQRVRELLAESFAGQKPLAFTHSYGCQENASDGEIIRGLLLEMGYELTDEPSKASFILLNTCAVREHAEDRVFGNIGLLKKYKAANEKLVISVCGCMPQQPHTAKRLRDSFPYVDLVFGTNALHKFPRLLYELLTKKGRVFSTEQCDGYVAEGLPLKRSCSIKAFLPVNYGCNNFCSYCVVPLVRGRERSREYDVVLSEAEALIGNGVKELMLLGQNVNSYGKDFGEKELFSKLLYDINSIPGDFIIRFMTSHPKDCSRKLLDTAAECSKVERHLHLPFQSGNDRILKAMRRGYTREQYLSLLSYARSVMPELCVTSDVIVGFPGETEAEFEDTLSLVREARFSSLYIFAYSKREGTAAAELPAQLPAEEKSRRFSELQRLQELCAAEQSAAFKGQVLRVLVEGKNKRGKLCGKSSGNISVELEGPDSLIGSFAEIKIKETLPYVLKGEPVQKQL